jgi:2-oxoglutarate ferredoxin oxidoreductase subunit alpha
VKSFRIAEKYQTPVIVLTDFFLGNRVENVPLPTAPEGALADGNIYPDAGKRNRYQRFENTESGISPRAIPGMEGYIFTATGLEHSEQGVPEYGPGNHMRMTEKRHRKIQGAMADLPVPEAFAPPGELDVGVIAWGSTFGSALEAVQQARDEGLNAGALKITAMYPFHADDIRAFTKRCREILIPELNYEGQLANLIGHLHQREVVRLSEATGVPLSAAAIFKRIEALVKI